MCTSGEQVAPVTAADALGMLHSALDFLNSADVQALGVAGQRAALTVLGQVEAKTSVFRSAALAAFDRAGGPEADGAKTAASWLRHHGGHTTTAARAATRQSRAHAAHPAVAGALAGAVVTASIGSLIIGWTGKLPEELQAEGDRILVTAAGRGCGERELNILGARLVEEYRKTRPDPDDGDPGAGRGVYLAETMDGAGRLRGDLTPQATAALRAILDSLGKAKGPEDLRTPGERHHDAVQTAAEMLLAAGGLPARHGSPVQAEVITTLAELREMAGASALEEAWLGSHTPGAPVFLTGTAAQGACCDATLIPVVTGCPDWQAVEEIISLVRSAYQHQPDQETLRAEVARRCLDFCSGPQGAASMLRRALFTGSPYGTISLPLDVGTAESIPPQLRKAVILRDRHCAWPGGCDEPPARCDIHHLRPRSHGGPTKLANLGLLCKFHHLIAIHSWGWTLTLHPDGTWQATSPDRQTTHHSHDPPHTQAA